MLPLQAHAPLDVLQVVTDIIDRAKADYRATHKVGVQSCKVYIKPEEGAAYYVINKVSGKLEL